jgi:hypothetical protein
MKQPTCPKLVMCGGGKVGSSESDVRSERGWKCGGATAGTAGPGDLERNEGGA